MVPNNANCVKAYGQTVEAREEINSSLDDLPGSFANIDFSLRSYPEDRNIEEASVNLVLSILKAVEKSIKFYTSVQGELLHSDQSSSPFPSPPPPALSSRSLP